MMTGNTATRRGGGLYNLGTATLERSTVANNIEVGGGGAGISNRGSLTIHAGTVTGNISQKHGGGINNNGGNLTITDSDISGNSAGQSGGAIRNRNQGIIILTAVTISANSAAEHGGGISNHGPLTMSQVSVSGNTADANADNEGTGGGLHNAGPGVALIQDSVLIDNYDLSPDAGNVYPDCFNDGGTVETVGDVQIGDPVGCGLAVD